MVGIVLLTHAVVPHHHHFDTVESHSEYLGGKTSQSDKHDENPETHCHAFNIVVIQKSLGENATVAQAVKPHFDLYSSEINTYGTSSNKHVNQSNHFELSAPKRIFFINHSLRAPPAVFSYQFS